MPDAPADVAPAPGEGGSSPTDPAAARSAPASSEAASEAATETPGAHELPYREELRRKALHLLALALPLGTALLGKTVALWVLGPAALLALTCDALRSRSRRFARLIQRVVGRMMRADEWASESEQELSADAFFGIRVNGATWTLVTMALLVALFPAPVAVAAFSLFMIGDAAAALVGRRWGRTCWGDGPRTVEGTAAFVGMAGLAVAPLAAFGYLPAPWWAAALAVAVAAGAEALPRPLNDNLRVPLTAALVLHLLG
ncbi:MAG: phosphatidate cytidylyltransferase [Bacteroidetes bacterium SW_4_67_19]|nr:MAG: phosphatidate cytidylyltransferase [Bacteroidetes bacterium SW_4_67_19]